MSLLEKNRAAGADVAAADRPRCSCLPFGFWRGSRSRRTEDAPGKRRRRRRIRLRLSWLAFSWPWLRKSGKKGAGGDGTKTGKQRMGRRLLLLLKTSLQFKKALASVVSGDSSGLLPAKVGSFGGDAKKQGRSKPRPTADGTRQPQASTTTAATGARGSTAPARPGTNQPCTTTTPDEPVLAGRIWRAPSRRHLLHPDSADAERPAGASGLWTAATTLGVIVLFGRVTAVFFLCSCLYGVRFVRARASAGAKSSGVAGASSSRRFGDPIGGSSRRFGDPIGGSSRRFADPIGVPAAAKDVELGATEGFRKKVVMAGLLDRTGNRPSSRFGR
ncbi:hypothetical protein EJB05_21917, partial [Eragrostis curvula]